MKKASDRIQVPFKLHMNLIIVEASINGEPAEMVLDTGASTTCITKGTADRLGLPAAEGAQSDSSPGDPACTEEAHGVGGGVPATCVHVDTLRLGELEIADQTYAALDLGAVCEKIGREVDGVLGFDFLSRFRTTIDYRGKLLTFEPQIPATNAA